MNRLNIRQPMLEYALQFHHLFHGQGWRISHAVDWSDGTAVGDVPFVLWLELRKLADKTNDIEQSIVIIHNKSVADWRDESRSVVDSVQLPVLPTIKRECDLDPNIGKIISQIDGIICKYETGKELTQ